MNTIPEGQNVPNQSIKIDDLASQLEILNSWIFERSVRTYQYLIMSKGYFELTHNQNRYIVESFLYDDREMVFWFPLGEDTLLASNLGDGYPLSVLTGVVYKPSEDIIEQLALPDFKRKVWVVGHPNFIHTLWNSGQAVLDIIQNIPENLKQMTFCERSKGLNVSDYLNIGNSVSFESYRSMKIGAVPLSSKFVSGVLSNIFLGYCERSLKKNEIETDLIRIRKYREIGRPILLLSVQEFDKRRLVNQVDFLASVITRLNQLTPTPVFIFDGFSVVSQTASIDRFVNKTAESINRILIQLGNMNVNFDYVNLNGMSVESCSLIYKYVNFALTHEGTQHHKVGWLYRIDHIIHSPSPYLPSVMKWHQHQSEVAALPISLPAEFISVFKDSNETLRNCDYLIDNIDPAVDFIEEKIKGIGLCH